MLSHLAALRACASSPDATWYDSIEVCRQPRIGDWTPVVAKVRERIEALARG